MLKVKMLKTTPGSPDGIRVQRYDEGEVYDLSDALAKAFVDHMNVAEYVVVGRRDSVPAAKMVKAAPENKDGGVASGQVTGQAKGKEEAKDGEAAVVAPAQARRA